MSACKSGLSDGLPEARTFDCLSEKMAGNLPGGTPYDKGRLSEQSELKSSIVKSINSMKLKPINDRIVVKPAPAEEKTKGGIIIPDTAKEKPQRGEVVAVGPGKDGNLMTIQVGDVVLYGKYSGQELNYDGNDYLIMREDDVLVVLQ
jgi:chaperonin GroES